MPAVNTNNILSLPRILCPVEDDYFRRVIKIGTAPSGYEGEGFPVRRALYGLTTEQTDPFIMMDQMGEVEYEVGEAKGTPWHPHRGFETVTYLIDGVFKHKDSNGGGGIISDGDTQWMTAGSGLLHIEAPTEEAVLKGGLFHGVQIWVNLPSSMKWFPPRYQDILGSKLKLLSSEDGGSLIRLIAGSLSGFSGPGITHTPICLVHASISAGATLKIPWDKKINSIGYVLSGTGYAGQEKVPISTGNSILFGAGDALIFHANEYQDSRSNNMEVLLMGGLPIREPVAWYGPFVMNTKEELSQAFSDYQTGKLGIIPVDGNLPHT